jgi:HEAT repeat protein
MVAAYKLLNFGDAAAPAVPALVEALQKDSDAEVRVAAAISLSEMGKAGVPALPALRLATYDRSPEVRAEATRAIKHLEIAAKYSRPRKPAQEKKKKAKI